MFYPYNICCILVAILVALNYIVQFTVVNTNILCHDQQCQGNPSVNRFMIPYRRGCRYAFISTSFSCVASRNIFGMRSMSIHGRWPPSGKPSSVRPCSAGIS